MLFVMDANGCLSPTGSSTSSHSEHSLVIDEEPEIIQPPFIQPQIPCTPPSIQPTMTLPNQQQGQLATMIPQLMPQMYPQFTQQIPPVAQQFIQTQQQPGPMMMYDFNHFVNSMTPPEKGVYSRILMGDPTVHTQETMTCFPRPFQILQLTQAFGGTIVPPGNSSIFGATNLTNFPNQGRPTNPLTANSVNGNGLKRRAEEMLEPNTQFIPSEKIQFQYPSARLTAKKPIPIAQHQIKTNNPFELLNINIPSQTEEISANSSKTGQTEEVPLSGEEQKKQTPKIKPISMVRTDNYKELLNNIGESAGRKFNAKIGPEFIRIFPTDEEAHRKITKFMKDTGIEGYILPMGVTRPLKVVLKYIPFEYEEDEIKNALIAEGFPVIQVKRMTVGKTDKKLRMMQVHLQPDDKGKEIFQLTGILWVQIKVEKYRSPFKNQQCHKCQNFFHHSENCFIKPRCVKCGEGHHTDNCPSGKGNKVEKPKCCNCGGEHPASWSGCPKNPSVIRQNKIATRVNAQTSYSSFFQNPTQTGTPAVIPMTTNLLNNVNPNLNQATTANSGSPLDFLKQLKMIGQIVEELKKELQVTDLRQILNPLSKCLTDVQSATTREDKIYRLFEALKNTPLITP